MRFLIHLIAILGLSAAVLPAAAAQIGDSQLPLDIDAERMDVFDAERRIVLTGNVVAIQGESSIRAQRFDVYYGAAGTVGENGAWSDIERIVATEDVLYITPTQRARGDEGVYDLTTETITLTGDVVITQGENVITTNRFVTDLTTGNSSFGEEGDGERVRMVLVPARDGETAEEEPEG